MTRLVKFLKEQLLGAQFLLMKVCLQNSVAQEPSECVNRLLGDKETPSLWEKRSTYACRVVQKGVEDKQKSVR